MNLTVQTLILCILLCNAVIAADDSTLSLDGKPASISLGPFSEGRQLVRLPNLSFEIDITFNCKDSFTPSRLILATADTQQSFAASDLAGINHLTTQLTIPASQLGPVALDGFCLNNTASQAKHSLRLPSAISLQASLSCDAAGQTIVTYSATSLDIELQCNVSEASSDGLENDILENEGK